MIENKQYRDIPLTKMFSHSIYLPLINKGGWSLDLGCNDFRISEYLIGLGLKVIGIDPVKNINIPESLKNNSNFIYLQKACVGIKNSNTRTFYEYEGYGANSIYNKPEMLHRKENGGHADNPLKESYDVELITITELMKLYNINQFEYIKIDVEGAEYDILENFPENYCAKQFSVEFHDFLGLNPSNDIEGYHKNLNNNILKEYSLVCEEIEPLRGIDNGVFQRNDTLYILKDLFT